MGECYYLLPQIYLIRSPKKKIYLAQCAGLRLVIIIFMKFLYHVSFFSQDNSILLYIYYIYFTFMKKPFHA